MTFNIILLAAFGVLMSTAMASNATTPSLNHTVLVPSTAYDTASIAFPSTQGPLNVTSSVPMSTAIMTSSVAPTTAKPTTPKPTPSGDVTLSYKRGNISCVTISGKITFDVTYITTENTTKTATIDLTNKNLNSTNGECVHKIMENATSMIKAQWEGLYEMSVTFTFGSDASWYVSKITFNATASQNPDFTNATEAKYSATKSLSKSTNGGYHASSNHSYLCESNEKLELSKDVSVHFEHIRMQPFDMKSGNFSNADVCGGDNSDSKPNSLVPIIVGCALAGLIVIVLIAYLVGRRKSSRGYQQV